MSSSKKKARNRARVAEEALREKDELIARLLSLLPPGALTTFTQDLTLQLTSPSAGKADQSSSPESHVQTPEQFPHVSGPSSNSPGLSEDHVHRFSRAPSVRGEDPSSRHSSRSSSSVDEEEFVPSHPAVEQAASLKYHSHGDEVEIQKSHRRFEEAVCSKSPRRFKEEKPTLHDKVFLSRHEHQYSDDEDESSHFSEVPVERMQAEDLICFSRDFFNNGLRGVFPQKFKKYFRSQTSCVDNSTVHHA